MLKMEVVYLCIILKVQKSRVSIMTCWLYANIEFVLYKLPQQQKSTELMCE